MRVFYEIIGGDWEGCYYKSLLRAFDLCEALAQECGNWTPVYTDFEIDMEKYGQADVGQFTIIARKFKD